MKARDGFRGACGRRVTRGAAGGGRGEGRRRMHFHDSEPATVSVRLRHCAPEKAVPRRSTRRARGLTAQGEQRQALAGASASRTTSKLDPLAVMDSATSNLPPNSSPELLWSATAAAFLEGEAQAVLDRREIEAGAAAPIAQLPSDFEDFCRVVASDIQLWNKRFRQVAERVFVVPWVNATPFSRILREHWFWRWFELSFLLKHARDDHAPAIYNSNVFEPITLQYGVARINRHLCLVTGPVQAWLDGGREPLLSGKFARFESAIEDYWPRNGNDSQNSVPNVLYTQEQLIHYAQARPMRTSLYERTSLNRSTEIMRDVVSWLRATQTEPSIERAGAVAALASTRHAIRSFALKGYDAAELDRAIHAQLRATRSVGALETGTTEKSPELARILAHRQDTGFLAWNQYFQESLSLFDDRITASSYRSLAPTAFSKNQGRKWDKECRFLCDLFLSAEVTIYRYCVGEEGAYLSAVGAHCANGHGKTKADKKKEFMHSAAFDWERRRSSAAYRSADGNAVEYIPDTAAALNSGEVLEPDRALWRSAHGSLLAIPLRVNSCVWGVLELVSASKDHYRHLMRYKCEEVALVLSSAVLFENIFETLSRTERYWSDEFASDRGRRAELCYEIARLFLCDALCVYSAGRNSEGLHFNVRRFGAWASSSLAAGSEDDEDLFGILAEEVRDFLDSGQRVKEICRASTSLKAPVNDRRTFMVLISPANMMGWAGALAFSVPYPIAIDVRWEQTTFALGQLVGGLVSNLTSNLSWDREARQTLRHEYKRITQSLKGITRSLETRINRRLPPDERRVGDLIASDLGEAIMSLDRMSEALLADVYERLLNEDPRLVAVLRAKESFHPEAAEPINIRELFFRKFVAANNAEPARKLRAVYSSDGKPTPRILMDLLVLSDILGTLADNAAKYSVSGSEIIMSSARTRVGALTVTISNLGTELEKDERRRIFDDGFRGSYARAKFSSRGSGRGLGFARKSMEVWNGTLRYRCDSSGTNLREIDGRKVVWHRFTLTFPPSLVVEE
jgi:signal transduction histidine kinase